MKKILSALVLMFVLFSVGHAKSWNQYFYELIKSTNGSIRIVDEQGRTLTMDEIGVVISSNVALTVVITGMEKQYVLISSGTTDVITWLESIYNLYKSSVIVSDILYSGKVSTGSAGKIFASGNIVPDDEVVNISFYTEGGNAQVTCTFRGGIIYVREGIPAGVNVPVLADNPTFQCVLDAGTTLYYISDEVD